VIDVMAEGRYRVELPNHHRILAFVTAKMRPRAIGIESGNRVMVEMSPFDFSKGRIIFEEGNGELL